jgi:long-chain fatty acid transport protein
MAYVHNKFTRMALAVALSGLAPAVAASGFAIGVQSGSGTGNAFAGGAAAADDASVAWYNPAAMTALPAGRQAAAAGHLARPSFKYTDTGSTGVFAAAGSSEGGDGGDWAVIPNMFFTTDLGPRWRFGFAVNAPFGLATHYDAGWRGQLTALKSEVKSVNLNPSLAYKVSDRLSIGGGVSVQKLQAVLSNFAGAAGVAKLKADDVGFGFNLGMTLQATPATRFGFAYRSSVKHELEGSATFSANSTLNRSITADLRVPESVSFSVFSAPDPKWEVMADATWTRWSRLQQLNVVRTNGADAGTTLQSLPFNWSDVWRLSVGANYKMNERMKLRLGTAHDRTPTNDVDRTPRLPDQDRTWIAAGVQYRLSKSGVLDLGYAHEFMRDASVSTTVTGAPGSRLNGRFKSKADILSFQYTHSF